jgi:hypothetical protein
MRDDTDTPADAPPAAPPEAGTAPGGPPRPVIVEDEPVVAPPPPELDFEQAEEGELWTDDSGEDYTGWYCVRTEPFPCPAEGCDFVADFLTASHLVIVWPEMDDPSMLRHCAAARDVGRNPKPVEYEKGFGPACSYYLWEAAGFPVHAVRADDSGVYEKKRKGAG